MSYAKHININPGNKDVIATLDDLYVEFNKASDITDPEVRDLRYTTLKEQFERLADGYSDIVCSYVLDTFHIVSLDSLYMKAIMSVFMDRMASGTASGKMYFVIGKMMYLGYLPDYIYSKKYCPNERLDALHFFRLALRNGYGQADSFIKYEQTLNKYRNTVHTNMSNTDELAGLMGDLSSFVEKGYESAILPMIDVHSRLIRSIKIHRYAPSRMALVLTGILFVIAEIINIYYQSIANRHVSISVFWTIVVSIVLGIGCMFVFPALMMLIESIYKIPSIEQWLLNRTRARACGYKFDYDYRSTQWAQDSTDHEYRTPQLERVLEKFKGRFVEDCNKYNKKRLTGYVCSIIITVTIALLVLYFMAGNIGSLIIAIIALGIIALLIWLFVDGRLIIGDSAMAERPYLPGWENIDCNDQDRNRLYSL